MDCPVCAGRVQTSPSDKGLTTQIRPTVDPTRDDLPDNYNGEVGSGAEADRRLRAWKAEMPEVPSAYRPSGAFPVSALVALTVGAIVGMVAGAVPEIAGCIAGLQLGRLFVDAREISKMVSIILGVLAFLLTFVSFVAGGWVCSWCVNLFGRWGKNRNKTAAVTAAAISGLLSVVVTWVALERVGLEFLTFVESESPGTRPAIVLFMRMALILGAAVAAGTAGHCAPRHFGAAKFCEACNRTMRTVTQRRVALGGLRELRWALAGANLSLVARLLPTTSGDAGRVEVVACPGCSRGYAEATAEFKCICRGENSDLVKKESWLVASVELSDGDVGVFRGESSS
jgi:hypothetical protein